MEPTNGMIAKPLTQELAQMVQNLPTSLIEIVDWFENQDHSVWIVGGAIRNALLKIPIIEYDLATTMVPEEMKEYPDMIPTGEKFGTITFRSQGDFYEITTLRTEKGYGDGRRPDEVEWGLSLSVDLSRRDLSMNSMALDVKKGVYYDPYGGYEDLQRKKICAVGEPKSRLSEDALRILRTYRFMDQGVAGVWKPERALANALRSTRNMLSKIAPERIWSEFKRILVGKNASYILQQMADDGVLRQIFDFDWMLDDYRISSLDHLEGNDVMDRLVVLFRDAPRETCEKVGRTLKLSNKENKSLSFRHSCLGHVPELLDSSLRIHQFILGEWSLQHLRIEALFAPLNQNRHSKDEIEQRISRNQTLIGGKSTNSLATGEWIMAQTNIQQGPKLGALKNWLHREQIARNLTDLEQIETLLCTLPWHEDEFAHWPKLQFP
jgi:tRNA nucleotidyltransferase/poly(A) polymerase